MTDEQLRDLYRLAVRNRTPASRDGCPTSEAMLALVRREGDEDARLATFDHVLSCGVGCRAEYERLLGVERIGGADAPSAMAPIQPAPPGPAGSTPDVQDAGPPGGAGLAPTDQDRPLLQMHAGGAQDTRAGQTARPRRRWWTVPAAVAASAVLAVAITQVSRQLGRYQDVNRSGVNGGSVTQLAPPDGGQFAGGQRAFIWHAVPGASQYTLAVLDVAGAVVHITTTTDTMYVLPPTAEVSPGNYGWWVSAVRGDGVRTRSATRTVRITGH